VYRLRQQNITSWVRILQDFINYNSVLYNVISIAILCTCLSEINVEKTFFKLIDQVQVHSNYVSFKN
jgi:hypothetical protein